MRLKILLVFASFFFAVSAYAQYKAAVQGTIEDKSGAAVVGAQVTLTNQDTGVQHQDDVE